MQVGFSRWCWSISVCYIIVVHLLKHVADAYCVTCYNALYLFLFAIISLCVLWNCENIVCHQFYGHSLKDKLYVFLCRRIFYWCRILRCFQFACFYVVLLCSTCLTETFIGVWTQPCEYWQLSKKKSFKNIFILLLFIAREWLKMCF